MTYYSALILVVQVTVSPPPEKPLTRIRLCVNGRPTVFTPNITLRIPRVPNRAIPVASDSAGASVTKCNTGSGDLEVDILMEGEDGNSSNSDNGLARCTCKQAASMLKVYEEDGQQLPEDGYGSEEDGEGLTSVDLNIICDVEQLA